MNATAESFLATMEKYLVHPPGCMRPQPTPLPLLVVVLKQLYDTTIVPRALTPSSLEVH
jgi:hypothetical protein